MGLVYKVLPRTEWDQAREAGIYLGAPIDLSDGFIHFSTADQVEETVAKHFHGQTGLLLVAFNADGFGEALKWEPSRGGDLFPHLYATLDPGMALTEHELEDRADGGHDFPEQY